MSTFRQGQRRRMDKFSLGEVSFVDRPAQESALATIQKSQDVDQSDTAIKDINAMLAKLKSFPTPEEGETQADYVSRMTKDVAKRDEFSDQDAWAARLSYYQYTKSGELSEDMIKRGDLVAMLTSSEDGHSHGISLHGCGDDMHMMVHYAGGPDSDHMHDHQIVRMADGSYEVSENQGHTHSIDMTVLNNALLALMAKSDELQEEEGSPANLLNKEQSGGSNSLKEDDNMDKKDELAKAEERASALEAENTVLKTIAGFTADQKAYYDSLDSELDDDARKAFIEADVTKRDKIVKAAKAQDADPVMYTAVDGTEYRKSDGTKVINLAKSYDEDRKETIRIRKQAEDESLEKRAEVDLVNLPGEVEVRKAILKAVDGIEDEDIRGKAHEALKAHNAKLAGAFEVIGSTGAPSIEKSDTRKSAEDELDRLAKEMASKEGIGFYTAYEKVSEANPQLLNKAVNG